MKCKNTILNEMMANAAELIIAKIEYEEIVLEQLIEQGDKARVDRLQANIEEMTAAKDTIIKFSGCWA
jgi:hypothetical protein